MKKYFSENYWADQDIQLLVGKILRTGVSLASVTVLLGGILYLMNHGTQFLPDYSQFKGESNSNTTLGGILSGVLHLQAAQMIQLGVVFLIATPVFRVVFSLFGFILEKDKLYVFITLIVLGVILFSIFSGVKG
ncbi:DUF1634 domain-containing protein [Elizabethkingia meningoseptica]|uniref:DUF1634 domain-containing protein n=1 Tax=Elizabethkingia meningoseptica TaxID=238 RepID=UPI00084194C2|nr:DUF1634 domain-containing protein [Elizabethkingia meningoseptica]EJK5330156.1 DUF1634 domain-containing protein [Elizabethkingia meningoseptica]MDE5431025.1 DUF1634 domain-containing protein [Elizabethkingia meningoseptica]MDE5437504.1 DUF1634 domain-containing protein [Elizabethkingia meningoseptica]MDE5467815.1 DUF1634 domain-containing protein [Elizabethkingia meningoseptica]MDE5474734.1 DUF1634 domain-containing protein [Elizabethkingia meningoseptica]